MKLYMKKSPSVMAHQIKFSTDEGILYMVSLMEQCKFIMFQNVGNRYPSIRFPDDNPKRSYSHGDYIVFDDEICKWYGETQDEFESQWEGSE